MKTSILLTELKKFSFEMNKLHLSSLLIFLSSVVLTAAAFPAAPDSVTFTSSNLPIIVINTHGQEIPDDYKITADMGIIYNGEGLRNNITDPYNNYNGKIGIEIRGSSSQMFPKKQYSVETRDASGNDLDVSLLGMPTEADWILFAPYNDKSLMRDAIVYRLARDMGRYASRSKYCEVVLNGQYVGIYVLFEKIKRDANRVNIKKMEATDVSGDAVTGGYIIKIDKTDGENNAGWVSDYFPFPQSPRGVLYQYHVPKPDEIVAPQKVYIQDKISDFETAMRYSNNIADTANGYPKYLDINSFADFVIINEVAKNVDAYRLSTYLYKDRDSRNPKIFAGPVWDFNLAFGNANYYEGWLTTGWEILHLSDWNNISPDEYFYIPFWWKKLFEDPAFQNVIYARWQLFKNNVFVPSRIDGIADSVALLLDESKTRNFIKWPVLGVWVWPNWFVGQSYVAEVNWLKAWIRARILWIDQNMVGGPSSVDEDNSPGRFVLEQNFPNPFSRETLIRYQVPENSGRESVVRVTLKLYNLLGQEIAVPVDEEQAPGRYNVKISTAENNPVDLMSGIYFYTLTAGGYSASRKMIVIY